MERPSLTHRAAPLARALLLAALAGAAGLRADASGMFGAAQGAPAAVGSSALGDGTLRLTSSDRRALSEARSDSGPSLVVLTIQGPQGEEGAFAFAELALKSGLFSKVSVGDDARAADYAVTGTYSTASAAPQPPAGMIGFCGWTPGAAGLYEWMDLRTSAHLRLVRRGRVFGRLDLDSGTDRVRVPVPFSVLDVSDAVERGLDLAYGKALARIARDILRREGRP